MVGVALFGCGGYGQALARALVEISGHELVGALDPEPGRAEAVGAARVLAAPGDALEDDAIEAVILATPNHLHREQALAVIAAGKHLFVEKPIATNVAAGLEIVQAALAAGVTLVVGHNLEELVPLAWLREEVGDTPVRSARFSFSRGLGSPATEGGWRFDPRSCPGGPLLQLGIHGVGILLAWFGPAVGVQGKVGEPDSQGVVATGEVTWQSRAGVPLTVQANYLGDGPFLDLVLTTTRGEYRVTPNGIVGPGFGRSWDLESAFHASRVALLKRFFGACVQGEPGNGVHALAALEVVLASC